MIWSVWNLRSEKDKQGRLAGIPLMIMGLWLGIQGLLTHSIFKEEMLTVIWGRNLYNHGLTVASAVFLVVFMAIMIKIIKQAKADGYRR